MKQVTSGWHYFQTEGLLAEKLIVEVYFRLSYLWIGIRSCK